MSSPNGTVGPSAAPPASVRAVLRDAASGHWLAFENPIRVLSASRLDEVVPLLREVDTAVSREHLHAVGFVSYEAAPAFDANLPARTDGTFPYLWFALCEPPRVLPTLAAAAHEHALQAEWQPSIDATQYRQAFDAIRQYIHNGDTYQINFTHRLRATLEAEAWQVFLALADGQDSRYAAFVDTGQWTIASASPELFFRLDGTLIESRPMKGTAARGLWPAQDQRRARGLRESPKERAENLMIVDMVRNDLGRVARTGSVGAPALFDVERYPTVWQMTSTVQAQTEAQLEAIFRALFPAASIVGAPRRRAMEIIAELETAPRRLYTGAIGFVAPGRRAQFNVAIRTVVTERATGRAEYGVGGGIVWDSKRERERRECEVKARVLRNHRPAFDLLETLAWTPGEGYTLLDHHLDRLSRSAAHFGFDMHAPRVMLALRDVAAQLPAVPHRMRLLMDRKGHVRCEARALADGGPTGFGSIGVAAAPIDREDVFLYHKTTHRVVYEQALAACPQFGDVLLYNQAGEVTESTIANVAVEIGGVLYTPPVRCGLLAGTWRAWMLKHKRLQERVLRLDDVLSSPAVYLMNSVRGMHRARVVPQRVTPDPR